MSQNNKNYPYQYQPVPQQFPVTQQLYPTLPQVAPQPIQQQQQQPVQQQQFFQQMPVQQVQQQQPVRVVLMPQQQQVRQQPAPIVEQPKSCCRSNSAACKGNKCKRGCRLCCSGCCCGMFFVLLLLMIVSFPAISHLLAIKGHFDRCMNPDFANSDYQTFDATSINTINVEFTSIPGRVVIQPQYTTYYADNNNMEQPEPVIGQETISSDNIITVTTTSRFNYGFDGQNFVSNLLVDEKGVLNLNYLYNGHFWKKSCPRFDVIITVPSKVFDLINVKSNVGYTTIQNVNSKQINVTSEVGLIEVTSSSAETIDTRVNAIGAVRVNDNIVSSTIYSAVTIGRIQVSSFSGSVQAETHVGVTRIEVDENFAGSISLQTDIGGTAVRGFENVQFNPSDSVEAPEEPIMLEDATVSVTNSKRHRRPHHPRPHPHPQDPNMPDQPNPEMPPQQDPNMPDQPEPEMPPQQDPDMPQPYPDMPPQQDPNMPQPGDSNGHTDCHRGKGGKKFEKQIETIINGGGDRSVVASTMLGCIKVRNASYHPWSSSSSFNPWGSSSSSSSGGRSGSSSSGSSSSGSSSSSSSSGNDKVIEQPMEI